MIDSEVAPTSREMSTLATAPTDNMTPVRFTCLKPEASSVIS